jgi:chemotaxis protein methyltransferase CheR
MMRDHVMNPTSNHIVTILSHEDFQIIKEMIYSKAGIVLSDDKKNMVRSRLSQRLRTLNIAEVKDYIIYLKKNLHDHDEWGEFINCLTTNLTSFFRENHHFDHFKEFVLDKMLNDRKVNVMAKRTLRIWSSACSTGEEPYSIAMTILDNVPYSTGWDIKILATDIDTNILAKAQKGIYKNKNQLSQSLMEKYCKPIDDDHFEIKDTVKKLITFKPLNLLKDWPMKSKFDVIFCRNVVIYFDRPTQEQIFTKMGEFMNDDGWLYIGHSESLFGLDIGFTLKGKTTYQYNDNHRRAL